MIFSIYYYWSFFSDAYLSNYPAAAIACILLYWILKNKWKPEMINWLYVFNTIVPWLVSISFGLWLGEIFVAWYGQNLYEWYTFSETKAHIWNPYGWGYWLLMIGNYLVPQLFWFKKSRKSIALTFLVVLFLSPVIWYERLVIFITSFYRDYLPSSWSTTSYNSNYILQLLVHLFCFAMLSSAVYWFFYKRKKLPFPSAILPYSLFFISYSLFHCSQNFN